MSKERARRREEREREAAVRAAARAAEEERAERRAARRRALGSWLPQSQSQPRPRATGVLETKRRNQTLATLAVVVLANAASFAFLEHWAARMLVLIVSVLAAPVLHTLLFRRR
jgi:Flp pilus assembly protein TadB